LGERFQDRTKPGPKSVQYSAGWQWVVKSHKLHFFFTFCLPKSRVAMVNSLCHPCLVLNWAHEPRVGPALRVPFDEALDGLIVVHL
jgi:hypothetical protein